MSTILLIIINLENNTQISSFRADFETFHSCFIWTEKIFFLALSDTVNCHNKRELFFQKLEELSSMKQIINRNFAAQKKKKIKKQGNKHLERVCMQNI